MYHLPSKLSTGEIPQRNSGIIQPALMYTDSENNFLSHNMGISTYKKEPELTAQINPKAY